MYSSMWDGYMVGWIYGYGTLGVYLPEELTQVLPR